MDTWWRHESLSVDDDRLVLDGLPVTEIAREHGTPLYVYSRATVRRQIRRMQDALGDITEDFKIYYAMKANRFPGVLDIVRDCAGVGVDTCSPGEVTWALDHGFSREQLSLTCSMLSDSDLAFAAETGIYCVLDSFSVLKRYGEKVPHGTCISLRLDPVAEVSYGYSHSKFGFEYDALDEAHATATAAGLTVDGLHMHIGWNLKHGETRDVDRALRRLASAATKIPDLRVVNVGGGLGGKYRAEDKPLELSTWSRLIRKHLAPLGVTIACEPGTFITRPAGLLIVEVNTVEQRRNAQWVGVNAGFAVNSMVAFYQIPLVILPAENPAGKKTHTYTVAGHMNDAIDVWARDCPLPELREGDLLAFYPCGAYGSSMRSDHCMRGEFTEVMV